MATEAKSPYRWVREALQRELSEKPNLSSPDLDTVVLVITKDDARALLRHLDDVEQEY